MKKPVLIIMAAGMGSRYGGLKQIDPIDKEGHIIMDFSLFDAKRAGFEKVIFIIKKENEEDFKEAVGKRIEQVMDVSYVYQDLFHLPQGYHVPQGRVKPWGTAHAVPVSYTHLSGTYGMCTYQERFKSRIYKVDKDESGHSTASRSSHRINNLAILL